MRGQNVLSTRPDMCLEIMPSDGSETGSARCPRRVTLQRHIDSHLTRGGSTRLNTPPIGLPLNHTRAPRVAARHFSARHVSSATPQRRKEGNTVQAPIATTHNTRCRTSSIALLSSSEPLSKAIRSFTKSRSRLITCVDSPRTFVSATPCTRAEWGFHTAKGSIRSTVLHHYLVSAVNYCKVLANSRKTRRHVSVQRGCVCS